MDPVSLDSKVAQAQVNQLDNDPAIIQAGMMREERAVNLIDQINPDNLMVDIEHRIRGEKKDPYTQQWVPIGPKKKEINEELISNFMSFLGSILNQNTSLSNFSPGEINNLMRMIIAYIGRDLDVNCEKYGIVEDYPEWDRIANIVSMTCFATFKQAMNGMLSKRVFGSMQVSASLTEDKKPTVMDALKFWG